MRKIITVATIVVVATLTTAWAVSNPPIKAYGGGGTIPAHATLLW